MFWLGSTLIEQHIRIPLDSKQSRPTRRSSNIIGRVIVLIHGILISWLWTHPIIAKVTDGNLLNGVLIRLPMRACVQARLVAQLASTFIYQWVSAITLGVMRMGREIRLQA